MKMSYPLLWFAFAVFAWTTPATASDAANQIEAITEDLRAEKLAELSRESSRPANNQIAELQAAIERGEAASRPLREHIAQLQEQKQGLEKVQVMLTSGLIGALVTAAIAVLGLLGNLGRSRAERDLRWLEVIEKTYQLHQLGVPLPEQYSRFLRDKN